MRHCASSKIPQVLESPTLAARGSPEADFARTACVEVRQARVSDRDAIANFIEQAYGELAPYKANDRWNWQFLNNPFCQRTGDLTPMWIAIADDRVVGQVAVQETWLQISEAIYPAGWLVDVMVLPEYRGSGLGHRLHSGAAAGVPTLLTLTMAPATRRMAQKAGGITLPPVHQYTRWMRLTPQAVYRYLMSRTENHPRYRIAAQSVCRVGHFHQVFSAIVNVALRCRDAIRHPLLRSDDLEIVEVKRFGDEFDRLWRQLRCEYPVIVPRDSRFLNWRFVECPGLSYHRFVARRNGKASGYAVLRRCEPNELPLGVIVDLFASRTDTQTIEALVWHALQIFRDEVAAVECATSIGEYAATLRSLGFYVTRTMRPTYVCQDSALRDRLEQRKDQWFLSKADHDWDQIHLA